MKSIFTTIFIITGLVITLWGAGQYVFQKIKLQQTEISFAQSEGYGETEEQKQVLQKLKKTLRNNSILLAAGAFLIFLIIGQLNKPTIKVFNKTSKQS